MKCDIIVHKSNPQSISPTLAEYPLTLRLLLLKLHPLRLSARLTQRDCITFRHLRFMLMILRHSCNQRSDK